MSHETEKLTKKSKPMNVISIGEGEGIPMDDNSQSWQGFVDKLEVKCETGWRSCYGSRLAIKR